MDTYVESAGGTRRNVQIQLASVTVEAPLQVEVLVLTVEGDPGFECQTCCLLTCAVGQVPHLSSVLMLSLLNRYNSMHLPELFKDSIR